MSVGRFAAIGSLVAAGCGFPQPEAVSNDGDSGDGPGSGSALVHCPAAPSGTVRGCAIDSYSSGATVPEDLSTLTVKAYVTDESPAGYRVSLGGGSDDGSFAIPNVPDGPYMLEVDSPGGRRELFVLSSHQPDFGVDKLGRFDQRTVTRSTPITYAISGMTPWAAGDDIEVVGFSVATETDMQFLQSRHSVTGAPSTGDVSLNLTMDWLLHFTVAGGLIDSSHGDDLSVIHYSPTGQIVDILTSSSVTMQDGQPQTITGVFSHVPQSTPLDVHLAATAFVDDYDNQKFGVQGASTNISVDSPTSYFDVSLAFSQFTPGMASDAHLQFGNPFSADRIVTAQDAYERGRSYLAPGTINSLGLSAYTNARRVPASPYTVREIVAPVSGIKVAGSSAYETATADFDGTTPLSLAWNPAFLATYYRVDIFQEFASGSNTDLSLISSISTTDTVLLIPPDVLKVGERYVFSMSAIADPESYAAGILRRTGVPHGESSNLTGPVLLSVKCGNNIVDAGEECDTGSESATCNVDCSVARCGDGITNTHAGEVCDNVGDTPTCDTSCHTKTMLSPQAD